MARNRVAKEKKNAIIIGIDFGTTFSGVSWAHSGQPDDIEVISRWESKMNLNSDKEKVPSSILFRGKRGNSSWGYAIPNDGKQEPLKWFKLLLVDECDLPENVRDSSQIEAARKLARSANKEPVEIISRYLQHLWNHAIECIGSTLGDVMVKMCQFHVVITLPAIWPDYAKARMRRAAEDAGLLEARPAGMTSLSFISEPEAAALATMKDLSKMPTAKVGNHIVVCDAGGGTVDLITYEILSLKPFIVREAVQGDGDLCGGVFLDEAFVKMLQEKVTPQAWNNIPKGEVAKLLNNDWEYCIKPSFKNLEDDWHVSLPPECRAPGSQQRGLKRKRNLVLDSEDLLEVFDPVVNQTISLVKKQIDAVMTKTDSKPKQIILVGGFGRCPYLRSRLKEEVGKDVEILQGHGAKPWTAICRGATIHGLTRRNLAPGLAVEIQSRVSRLSYGTCCTMPYDPVEHNKDDKFWCKEELTWKVDNCIEWFLERGTDVSTADPVSKSYYRLWESVPSEVSDTIYSSAVWPPPKRLNDSVNELCTIAWRKKIKFSSLPRFTNPMGKVFAKITYDMEMTCSGRSVDFTVIHDGKQVAAKNVEVVFKSEDE
ncbi:hypothetical protein CORC01_12318 [Colletotrichum orchidophilum]|uniref:Hsp70-like protein n=1 Tax=Colletotrichum orchidophilum TaxID=1209926 RepID=A0A1G4ATF9_9PEZI|nr:uncharacterized protein CORC01_12318 [Colletotrichum orchidophilum]OHE92391.1 hypothetical protein CORC01_12318 [Colletotrichum orchidophilum]